MSTAELIRIADEEPGGFDAAVEMLLEQGENGRAKLRKAYDDPRHNELRPLIAQLMSATFL